MPSSGPTVDERSTFRIEVAIANQATIFHWPEEMPLLVRISRLQSAPTWRHGYAGQLAQAVSGKHSGTMCRQREHRRLLPGALDAGPSLAPQAFDNLFTVVIPPQSDAGPKILSIWRDVTPLAP